MATTIAGSLCLQHFHFILVLLSKPRTVADLNEVIRREIDVLPPAMTGRGMQISTAATIDSSTKMVII